jgi:hypothetical protein
MEQGWWPLSTFRDIARVTTDTVEKQPASKKESVAAVPVSPAEPDGDEPPRTTSRPPDVSPQNLARNEAAHDSAGYSGAEKAIGASRPSRPADTDVAVAPKTAPPPQAPPEPARVDDRPRETPLIGHEVPAPLPPAPLAVDQSPGASVTAGPKQQAPPPQNIRPAPEVGGAQTSTASPRSNATAATEETIFERQGPDAVVITTVPSPAANGADATNARPARAVAGETEDGHPASAMVETSQSAAFVPPPFPVAPTDDKAEKTPVSASQDVTAAPNAAPATSPPEIPNTDIARPSAMAAVHTDAVPPKAPQPETPAAATPSPSPSLPEGLEHPVPDRTAALPQTPVASYSTEDRLRGFIRAYAQAYESRDLERFRLFFTDDAVENGRSFSKVLPTYRKNFAALSGLEYTIKLMSWKKKDAAGGITLKGTFDVRYHMPNRDWRTTQGKITMDLVSNGGAYRVKRLNYSKK